MIILRDKPGQLCNRLWAFSPFIATALEHNIRLYMPFFEEYYSQFDNLEKYKNIKFYFSKNRICNFLLIRSLQIGEWFIERLYKYLNLSPFYVHIVDGYVDYAKILKRRRVFLVNSWFSEKNNELLLKHKDKIINLFTPPVNIKKKVDTIFSAQRNINDIVVGVHIRKGDYKDYRNGMYYFEESIYLEKMRKIKEEFDSHNKQVIYFLSSDSIIDLSKFEELKIFFNHESEIIEDLYSLSKCDYIMGPPSSFSMWASFFGNVPLKFIYTVNTDVKLSRFSPIIYQNIFDNGERLNHMDNN